MASQTWKKDMDSFILMNYISHTPYFARSYYPKCGMHLHMTKKELKLLGDASKYNYVKKWRYLNRCLYAMIEYLKDAFLLLSFLNKRYEKFISERCDDDEKIIFIADCLDELLNRNIKKFISCYYVYSKKEKEKLKYNRFANFSKFHLAHRKYYECNSADEFIKKYLNNNLYTKLNIFGFQAYDSIDGFRNKIFLEDLENKIMEKEELFLKWVKFNI